MGLAEDLKDELVNQRPDKELSRTVARAYQRAKQKEELGSSENAIRSEFGLSPRRGNVVHNLDSPVPEIWVNHTIRRDTVPGPKERTTGRMKYYAPGQRKCDLVAPINTAPARIHDTNDEDTIPSFAVTIARAPTEAEIFKGPLEARVKDAEDSENLSKDMHVPETAQTGRDAHSGYLPRPSDISLQERAITVKAQYNSTDVRTPDAKKQRRIRRPLQDISEAGVNARPRLGSNETTTKDPLYSGRINLSSTENKPVSAGRTRKRKLNTLVKTLPLQGTGSTDIDQELVDAAPAASLDVGSASSALRDGPIMSQKDCAPTVNNATILMRKGQKGARPSQDGYRSLSSGAQQLVLNVTAVVGLIKGWSNKTFHAADHTLTDDETYGFHDNQTEAAAQSLGFQTAHDVVEYLIRDPDTARAHANHLQKIKLTVQKGLRRGRLMWNLCSDRHEIPKSQTTHTVPSALILHTAKYFKDNVDTIKSRMGKLPKGKGNHSKLWRNLVDISSPTSCRSVLFLFVLTCAPKQELLEGINHGLTPRYDDYWYDMVVRECLETYSQASGEDLQAVEAWFKEVTEKFH